MTKSVKIEVSADYGFVIIVVFAGWIVVQYLAKQVMSARKKYDVPYPQMYSDKSKIFNCYQRAHQNTIEGYSNFLVFLLLGGLYNAKLSAIFGVIFLLGRIIYAHGYYTGDPSKRNRGAIGYIGYFGLMGNSIMLAYNLISAAYL